jgi:hypothetical protein
MAAMQTVIETKKYIGDGVYAEFSGWDFKLTTQRENVENTIYLEPPMIALLYNWMQELRNQPNPQLNIDD